MTTLNIPSSPSQGATYEANGVVYTWDGTKWKADSSYVSNLNGGQLAGFRNQLINAGFQIDQRGLSGVSLAGTKYCLDRWVASSGATVTQLNVTPGGMPKAISYAGGNTPGYIRQAIELAGPGRSGQFSTPGLDWTFSVYSDVAPQFDAFFADDNIATNNKTSWQTLTTMVATGRTITSNVTDTLNQYSITISNSPAPASTNTCLIITMRDGSIYSGPQFEPGPVATPFEHRPIGTELALCQRYYQTVSRFRLYTSNNGSGSTNRFFELPRAVVMRTDPTETSVTTGMTFTGTADAYHASGQAPDINSGKVCLSYTADAEL